MCEVSGSLRFVVVLSLLYLQPGNVFAEAGKAVFVQGEVVVVDSDGEERNITKGGEVNAGDTLVTRKKSTIQLRMIDRGFVALRSESKLKIDDYRLGEKKEEDRGFLSLLKGGLRAITGVIGKRNRDSYRLNTSVVTIGVRGTDYSARLCNDDCGNDFNRLSQSNKVDNGLYVGVLEGGITMTNSLGTLDVDRLQYGYVADANSAPVALRSAPDIIYFKSRPPEIRDEDSSDASSSTGRSSARDAVDPPAGDYLSDSTIESDLDAETGEFSDDDIDETVTTETAVDPGDGSAVPILDGSLGLTEQVVMSAGPVGADNNFTAVTNNLLNSIATDTAGGVAGFESEYGTAAATYGIGTASNIDLGYDPTTGISWGRWANGTATANIAGTGTINVDLNNSSLHWINGPATSDAVSLPVSGTSSYNLIGNTAPTDNLGNTGFLSGTSNMTANFTSMTVDTQIDVGINNQVWNATGSGLQIANDGTFGGALSVTGSDATSGAFTGQGSADGFFTNNAVGAGMGFSMDATVGTTDTSVSGAAVFQQQ